MMRELEEIRRHDELHLSKTSTIILFVCVLVIGLMIGCSFWWTKNSLEESSGKEVSNLTVLWRMFVTGEGK